MPEFRPGELSQWVSRMWKNGMPDQVVTGISNDTRTLKPGDLYVAIRGERFDGHAYTRDAFQKGAVGALVDDHFTWTEDPVLSVTDTVKGLWDLARGYRKKWMGGVIGITGSVGKTTVKEMCADVLSMEGETHRTAGNYNNHIGLPLTMLSMPATARHGVFEIGMNHPGEIGPLSDLLRPKIALITDICAAHRESFSSVEAIAREKMKLAERVPESGFVILDRDSEWYAMTRRATVATVVTVSLGGVADYVGRVEGDRVMSVNGHAYEMPLPGQHVMRNALRAIALGLEMGMDPDRVAAGLMKFKSPPMRWNESEIEGVIFINDAYNANPLSMRAGLKTLAELPATGAKWAVLGGMRELGEVSEREHAALGRYVDELGLDGVIAVGALGETILFGGSQPSFHCSEAAAAAEILKSHVKAGDRVLLKASRGERLEDVLTSFKEL